LEAVLTALKIIAGLVLAAAAVVLIFSKCFFLAPFRIGWVVWFTNLLYETAWKKLQLRRWPIDAAGLVVLAIGWAWVLGPWVALAFVLAAGLAWANVLRLDLNWRTGELTIQDKAHAGAGTKGDWQYIPIPLPRLVLMVWGPVLDRCGKLDLGDWPEGHEAEFELLVLNPSPVVPQYPMRVELSAEGGIRVLRGPAGDLAAPDPGRIVRLPVRLRAGPSGGGGAVHVDLRHRSYHVRQTLTLRSVVPAAEARPVAADIRKWKGGAGAGFAWRGDHDLYDPATFQSAEGLRLALTLAKRFLLPTTIYMSGRLSLDVEEHRDFCEHFGFDRRSDEIPGFVRFLREECDFQAELDFPLRFESGRPFQAELGNHMYLHYGTHATACPGNQWKLRAEMGQGTYPWQGADKDTFSEQRDNAARNIAMFRDVVGAELKGWGVPGRANDRDTARALEAAGVDRKSVV